MEFLELVKKVPENPVCLLNQAAVNASKRLNSMCPAFFPTLELAYAGQFQVRVAGRIERTAMVFGFLAAWTCSAGGHCLPLPNIVPPIPLPHFLTPPPPLPHPAIYCTISVCFMMLSFFYSCSYFFLSCIPTGNIVLNCVLNTAILNCKYINKRNIIMQVTQSLQHKNIQFTLTMEKTALIIESSNNEEQKWYQQKRILKRRRALVQGAKLCRIMWCVFQRLRSLGWIRILSRAEQKTGNSSVWLWWCTLRSFFVRTANAMWDWWCARLLYPAFFKKSSPFSL